MPVDPAAAVILRLLEEADTPPIEEQTPEAAREAFGGMVPMAGAGADVASVVERSIGEVDSLVVTPHGTGPFPVLVWMHGGGWVIGSAAESVALASDLAAAAGCIVVSLDYRLAPEHPAPAAIDDCLAATSWVLEHAAELGGDPDRVAVGGDSAGGNLAALVAQQLGDRVRYQVLVYPATDLTASHPSIEENAEGYLLTKAGIEWFVHHYLDRSPLAADDPVVSPLRADDSTLAAAPPALVITAELDPLRDEGEAYVERLRAAGVDVAHRRFDGQIHGFFGLSAAIPAGSEAIALVGERLRDALG